MRIFIKEQKTYVEAVMVTWRDIRLSTNMLKIHGIEDHLVNQMKKPTELDASMKTP